MLGSTKETWIDGSFRSANYDARAGRVSALVFHYTGMRSKGEALERLCDGDGGARVSAHYVVSEEGEVYRLVEERYRAWHAGVGSWRGCSDLNDCSVGIEVVNQGHEFGYRGFPQKQMEAVLSLSRGIVRRHKISMPWVLGHSDIAVGRKRDPGELFDWRYLARGGVGFFPERDAMPSTLEDGGDNKYDGDMEVRLGVLLGLMGYDCARGVRVCIEAFQRRWRVSRVDGVADEECVVLAEKVLRGWGEL